MNGRSIASDCNGPGMSVSEKLEALNLSYAKVVRERYHALVSANTVPDIEPAFVFGCGSGCESVVMIGEAPGRDEVAAGKPFVGSAGKILDHLLEKTGIDRGELYITNTVKYRLARYGKRPGSFANRPAKKADVDACIDWLLNELYIIRPEMILTLGNTALNALLTHSGREIDSGLYFHADGSSVSFESKGDFFGAVLYPLYHPAALIYNPELRDRYERDLEEVKLCRTEKTAKQ